MIAFDRDIDIYTIIRKDKLLPVEWMSSVETSAIFQYVELNEVVGNKHPSSVIQVIHSHHQQQSQYSIRISIRIRRRIKISILKDGIPETMI